MSTPATTIYICSGVRLNPRYEHSIYFADATAQAAYFAGKVVKTFSAYSYVRKSWPLKVNATMEQAKTWSYLYFRNGSSGKVYYYFITNVEYKNEDTVELTLELDVLQTYMFDFELLHCFVERQHTTTDEPGEYTLDEGLDIGTEMYDDASKDWTDLNTLCILTLASINPNSAEGETPVQALAGLYNNTFSGLKIWATPLSMWQQLEDKLDALSTAGFIDGIVSMWMYPRALVTLGGENTWTDEDVFKTVASESGISRLTASSVGRPSKIGSYTPKNKKLLTFPFTYLYATNNLGNSAVYRYERFDDPTAPAFGCVGAISPDGVMKMYPFDYNTSGTFNYECGLTLGNFPSCAWDSDTYKLWLAQNQNQHALAEKSATIQAAGGALGGIASLLTGNLVGAGVGLTTALSGASQIASQMAQKADMATQPPQARGNFSSSVNLSMLLQTFTLIRKRITEEHARTVDNYFTMYGYKLNRVQQPNIAARPAFTYIKTIGCHIKSNMCTDDALRIESIFDKGITFWKNGDRIGDYSIDNSV